MNRRPTNTDDLIDSRDVIAAIEEMRAELTDDDGMYLPTAGTDEIDTLDALIALASQGEDNSEDWQYGATLIRDSYFLEYTQELAEECYTLLDTWPFRCIDWHEAAAELQTDYSSVEFDGVTYWVR